MSDQGYHIVSMLVQLCLNIDHYWPDVVKTLFNCSTMAPVCVCVCVCVCVYAGRQFRSEQHNITETRLQY